jgi:hypothetical protein
MYQPTPAHPVAVVGVSHLDSQRDRIRGAMRGNFWRNEAENVARSGDLLATYRRTSECFIRRDIAPSLTINHDGKIIAG